MTEYILCDIIKVCLYSTISAHSHNFGGFSMNAIFARIFTVIAITLSLSACTLTPKEKTYNQVVSLGCSLGNGDAFADFANKKVDLNYFPKEELKIFFFDDYVVPDNEKEGLKQLFKLSARGCYIDLIRKQDPGKFKL